MSRRLCQFVCQRHPPSLFVATVARDRIALGFRSHSCMAKVLVCLVASAAEAKTYRLLFCPQSLQTAAERHALSRSAALRSLSDCCTQAGEATGHSLDAGTTASCAWPGLHWHSSAYRALLCLLTVQPGLCTVPVQTAAVRPSRRPPDVCSSNKSTWSCKHDDAEAVLSFQTEPEGARLQTRWACKLLAAGTCVGKAAGVELLPTLQ